MGKLFVYVDGYDLDGVESRLLDGFKTFAVKWNVAGTRVVNDKPGRTPDMQPDDLPEWNLGLNVESEKIPRPKVEELIQFLSDLARQTGREFVIGRVDMQDRISEDWCFIGAEPKPQDVEWLAQQLQ